VPTLSAPVADVTLEQGDRLAEAILAEPELGSGIRLVSAAAVRPERVRWAVQDRIPLGMVTLLVGEGKVGKSTEGFRYLAGLTRGTVPGDLFGQPVKVAIASAEDHRAAVIVPRLIAAGADLSRVTFVEQLYEGEPGDIELDGQVAELERALAEANVRALLIDTVVAHIPGRVDSYKEQSVRAVLKPVSHMAERLGVAVVGIMHMNRRESKDVLTRIAGSGAFGNLARSALLFGRDPEDADPKSPFRIELVARSNVTTEPDPIRLRVEPFLIPAPDGGQSIQTYRLAEVGTANCSEAQMLSPTDQEDAGAESEAREWLADLLAHGPVPAGEALRQARQAGIAERTLRRAKSDLGVRSVKAGMGAGWAWTLPPEGCQAPESVRDQTPEDCQAVTAGSLRQPWQPSASSELPAAVPARPVPVPESVAAALHVFPTAKVTRLRGQPVPANRPDGDTGQPWDDGLWASLAHGRDA